jgi:DNA-3-methyladenine glycosylase
MEMNVVDDHPISLLNLIPEEFYSRNAVEVARDLLGKLVVRIHQDELLAGQIIEAEAYQGEEDLGCHAKAGLTARTRVMYGPPGRAYIYFTYGMHWMLNAVTGAEGVPGAVLIRGFEPVYGLDSIRKHRPQPKRNIPGHLNKDWTDGPAKLCQALGLDGSLNGINLCERNSDLWISDAGVRVPDDEIGRTPRIGMNTVPEPWFSIPWRFVWNKYK